MAEHKTEHLKDLLESFDTAMLITRCGELEHARPMAIAKIEGTKTIWFATSEDTPKADEIRKNSRVSATFQSERRFVALSGHAELVVDRAKIHELWRPMWKVWFPKGKHDPKLALVRVSVEDAEFWDNAGMNGIRFVFAAAKALVSHKPPTVSERQHGRVKEAPVAPISRNQATEAQQPVPPPRQ